jgi:hypothetical protein
MPRGGAIIFADLIGKLDVLYVHCSKCSRAGHNRVQHLIEERGGNGKLIDWLDEITADCPKKQAHNMVHCPHDFSHSTSAFVTATGCSRVDRWPLSGTTTRRDLRMPAAISWASSGGVASSPSPTSTRVG